MVRTFHTCFSLFQKEPWGRLTNTVVSGTMSTRNGGFAIAPYLSRDYCFGYDGLESSRPKLHLTYPGIIASNKDAKELHPWLIAPYLSRDYYIKIRCSLAFCQPCCTLPMQGLLRRHGQSSLFEVAPYLSRYQAQTKTPKSETP